MRLPMTPVYGLWETVDVPSGHRPPHVKQPNIANLVYICTIKVQVHGRETIRLLQKHEDCWQNEPEETGHRKVQTSGRVHTERTR